MSEVEYEVLEGYIDPKEFDSYDDADSAAVEAIEMDTIGALDNYEEGDDVIGEESERVSGE